VDAWRHQRMIAPISPLCSGTDWEWLTVGDAHGWDAARLQRMGCRSVTASDLSVQRLRHAAEEGLIEHYREENAESMTAGDGAYDVVFCKEALHHFPRPWIGLYEMLRVARQAVVLIEPRDWVLDRGPVRPVGPRGVFWFICGLASAEAFQEVKASPSRRFVSHGRRRCL
jgi:ubiquinone/menaquinone biosynthesis C-methylase UbiE